MRFLARIFIRPFLRIKYIGRQNIPKNGRLIICSNHISMLDPLIIAFGIRRKIFFMAKSEFFTQRGIIVKYFMKCVGAFPVKRNSSDVQSLSNALTILQGGRQVGIFPQGKIVTDSSSFDLKAGAALLAIKTNSPILPVSIYTDKTVKAFSKITVVFGSVIEHTNSGEKNSVKSARFLTKKIKEQISAQLEGKHCP